MPKKGYKQTEEHKQKAYGALQRVFSKNPMSYPEIRQKQLKNVLRGKEHHFYGIRGKDCHLWKGGSQRHYNTEARKVWEEYWREKVPVGYLIHHIDRDYTNNDICNLALLTPSYHAKVHGHKRPIGSENVRDC